MSSPELIAEVAGGVAMLTLNRPDRLNALSQQMCLLLAERVREAGADEGVRVIVLGGAGRAFSAGGDVKQMAEDIAAGRPAAFFQEPLAAIHQAASALRSVQKPVIAALHGAVAGAGLNLALCCDYRVASDDVVLTQAFTNIGLVPDTGGTYLLPRLVGLTKATEWLLDGRPVDAREAERWGLVNKVVPKDQLMAEVAWLAATLAARPTRALGLTKHLLDRGAVSTFDEQLELERRTQAALGQNSDDYMEGVRAFIEKRAATFTGR